MTEIIILTCFGCNTGITIEYDDTLPFARDNALNKVRSCKVCSPPDDEKKEIL